MSEEQPTTVEPSERAVVERVLNGWGGAVATGAIERLSGLTNRIYRVATDVGPLVVRIPGFGTDAYIDRSAELHNARVAADLGVGPPVLHAVDGVLVMGYLEGRVPSPEAFGSEAGTLAAAGRLLRRVHDSPMPFRSRFDPIEVIASHRSVLVEVPEGVDALVEHAVRLDPPARLVPCHNDPWPENFLDVDGRLHLLDWEYSAMGDPAWDLADVVVEARLDDDATQRFLMAYAAGPVEAGLGERVVAMGPITDLLWGLWALVQVQDGNDAMDFATYGHRRLRRAARTMG